MRKARILLLAALFGGVALAATKAKDTTGGPPTADTDGVSLGVAVGCRCSIRVDGGTDIKGNEGFATSGWKIVPWYFDYALGWVESAPSLHCSPSARLDGGRIFAWVCPDYEPLASFGRMSCTVWGVVGIDGGTGADLQYDAGAGPQPLVRTECWGPNGIGP